VFTKAVIELEEFEKGKAIKSSVAKGTPLCPAETVTATLAAREVFYLAKERARRDAARCRTELELREGARACVTNQTLAVVQAAQPAFDVYASDAFRLREASLGLLQQGVRTSLLRSRAADRLSTLQGALEQQGSSLRDAAQLVARRSREATGGGGAVSGADCIDAPALSLASIEPFAFPSAPPADLGAGASGEAPPMAPLPLDPFDDFRTFALRVPRRYMQMGYARVPLTNPGEVEADPLLSRPMRTGAAYESGAPLPTGDAAAFPLAPLPPLLLAPKPILPPPTAAAESMEALAAGGVTHSGALAPGATPDPFCSCTPPRTYAAVPQLSETDVEYHLRARPLATNDAWMREPTGLATARTLLGEETISARWRPPLRAWSDVAAPLPQLMREQAARDVDPELSEDESDTEVSVQAPTEARLREIFEMPRVAGAGVGGEGREGGGAGEGSAEGAAGGAGAGAGVEVGVGVGVGAGVGVGVGVGFGAGVEAGAKAGAKAGPGAKAMDKAGAKPGAGAGVVAGAGVAAEATAGGKAGAKAGATAAAEVEIEPPSAPPSIVSALFDQAEAAGVLPSRVMPVDGGSAMAVAEAGLQADLAARRRNNRARLGEALEALNQHIPEPRMHLRCLI
jgi:hypothetical protein